MRRLKKLLPIVLMIGLGLVITEIAINWNHNPENSDFFTFWLSGRLITQGLNPFSSSDWLHGHEIYHSTWIPNQTFVYPMPLAVFLAPLGLLDLRSAYMVWVFFTVISLYMSVTFLLRGFEIDSKYYVFPVVAGVVLFRPLVPLLLNGQISGFLLLVITLTVWLMEKKLWFWSGTILTLTMLKPQLGGILVIMAGWYFLRQKRYTFIAGIITSGVILILMGCIIAPNWVSQYFSILFIKYNQTFGYTPSIWGLAFYLTQFKYVYAIIIGAFASLVAIIAFGLLIWKNKTILSKEVLGVATTTMLLITPYLWPYDQILLVIPILMIMVLLRNLGVKFMLTSLVFIFFSILSYLLYALTIKIELENLNSLLTMSVLFTLYFVLIKTKKSLLPNSVKSTQSNELSA